MKIATYYLESGTEVEVYYENGEYTAQDKYVKGPIDFGTKFPDWETVAQKWRFLTREEW